jgi:hypothetical protein
VQALCAGVGLNRRPGAGQAPSRTRDRRPAVTDAAVTLAATARTFGHQPLATPPPPHTQTPSVAPQPIVSVTRARCSGPAMGLPASLGRLKPTEAATPPSPSGSHAT